MNLVDEALWEDNLFEVPSHTKFMNNYKCIGLFYCGRESIL